MPPDLTAIWAAYRADDAAQAVARAAALAKDFPRHGGVWYAVACARERAGDLAGADRAFVRAARASDDPVALPWRVSWSTFRVAVAQAAQALPPRFQAVLGEVSLVLADYAAPEDLADHTDAEVLGLFIGPVRSERDATPDLSPAIHLFRRAHEHACGSRAEFLAEVKTTLWHEFGHYLGYGEDGLASLGL